MDLESSGVLSVFANIKVEISVPLGFLVCLCFLFCLSFLSLSQTFLYSLIPRILSLLFLCLGYSINTVK